ncbi:PREDICTED: aspartic proteinase CDR1-like [Fragaria vesca subsp. vesca]|uniref:aspartic proteinase CDR1-like n=1 Tax=Fragaria vesca subsp. vesca TaxID=101020 RepID=UPI0002C30D4B|nr:PREDICTED: aspartic proteinase CDR1-like [Fragaria vesca subsp. vesca]
MAALATTAFALILLYVSAFSSVSAKGGFSIDLIHRDSPRSPFYNPLETQSQRLRNAFRRSFRHSNRFNPKVSSTVPQTDEAEATITNNRGEYLMELSIGTPPVPIKAIADTGSDLIWTQCKPCVACYTQTDPLFDPSKSSTYKTIPCTSNQCSALKGNCLSKGSGSGSPCQYEANYGDRSHTIGDLAVDTLTLASTTGRNVSFPKTIIGCGHDNAGTFDKKGSGIVGLGGGDESLISQLSTSIDGKFSYCLVPFASEGDLTSKLNFGDNALVSGSGVLSTPIIEDEDPTKKTFFFLTLEAISVGKTKIPFTSSSSSSASGGGNIIIDSGTTLTLLEQSFYSELEEAVDQVVGGERVSDPQSPIPLCYKVSLSEDLKVPNITVHFSGADVKLDAKNTFIRVSDEAVCFSFAPSESLSIYGNLAQAGFLVGYDLKEKTVSFKPTDCTKV